MLPKLNWSVNTGGGGTALPWDSVAGSAKNENNLSKISKARVSQLNKVYMCHLWHFPSTTDIVFQFILGVIFSSFDFTLYLEGLLLLTHFLKRRSSVWFLKSSLKEVSAIRKYFSTGILGSGNPTLYTTFAVKHLLSSAHLALFLQMQP